MSKIFRAIRRERGREYILTKQSINFYNMIGNEHRPNRQSFIFISKNCKRYDGAGTDIIATGGRVDGTVKIWNTSNGSVIATLKGGSSNSIISCDVTNGLVAGGGSDKTCRVWDIKTQRMVHQLVGHMNKITCVRFLGGDGRGIITASTDRQIKVWDISKQTYRQTTNIVLTSTANSIDVADDSYTVVSGHTDGGLRFWDIRTGQRSGEIESTYFFLTGW